MIPCASPLGSATVDPFQPTNAGAEALFVNAATPIAVIVVAEEAPTIAAGMVVCACAKVGSFAKTTEFDCVIVKAPDVVLWAPEVNGYVIPPAPVWSAPQAQAVPLHLRI